LLIPLLVALGSACSDSGEATNGAPASADAGSTATDSSTQREEDPAVRALREHVDLGRPAEAAPLLEQWGNRLGVEGPLIEARLMALHGKDTEAVRAVERARVLDPDDPRVYATMVEISAAAGRIETAFTALERGFEAVGQRPELIRAKGVLELCQSGGAERGVATLESALRMDPQLPFTDRALAQGYLLIAKKALATGQPTAALESIQISLSHDPQDVEARRVFADVLGARAQLEEAILVITELVDEGEPLEGELATLHKRAGIAGLIPIAGESAEARAERRGEALEHFVTARAFGLSEEELGSGARLLSDAALQASREGSEAYGRKELVKARAAFELALRYDPDELAARNHLAVTLFQLGEFAGAAHHWREVMVVMESEGILPPEPVHLNLAQALVENGDRQLAREMLERWLERNAESEGYAAYVVLTREALAGL